MINSLLNMILAFEVLILRLQNQSNFHFILTRLYDAVCLLKSDICAFKILLPLPLPLPPPSNLPIYLNTFLPPKPTAIYFYHTYLLPRLSIINTYNHTLQSPTPPPNLPTPYFSLSSNFLFGFT
jgi:hypothetical protein